MSDKNKIALEGISKRQPDYEIEPIFLMRWSPRAMTGDSLTDHELMRIFEAGRWAPSTYNEQEWRFLYAHRDTTEWESFFNLLVEQNKTWCKNAGVLVVIVGSKKMALNGKPNPVYQFDCGAAFQNMCLQATAMDIVSHGMAGFDYEKARTELKIPEDYEVLAMVALGKPALKETLTDDLQKAESPSSRRPIKLSINEGFFSF